MKKPQVIFFTLLLSFFILWFFTRFYHLADTTFFFNDTGRDYLEVFKFLHDGQIPWLGPANSATPLSQSAFYFYLLTPILWLSDFAPWANQLTLLLFTWTFFGLAAYLVYPRRRAWPVFFLLLALYTLEPSSLSQARQIWNPSFAWPGLFFAFFLSFFPPVSAKWRRFAPFVVGVVLAFSNAMSFIVAPAVIFFAFVYLFPTRRLQALKSYLLGFFSGSFLFFLPMLAFELRYQFQITRRFLGSLGGDLIRINGLNDRLDLFAKLADTAANFGGGFWFYFLLLLLLVIGIWHYSRRHQQPLFFFSLLGFFLTFILNLLFPVQIHSHYVIGLTFFLFAALSNAPGKSKYLLSALIGISFLPPLLQGSYFSSPSRLYSFRELEACAAQVCQKIAKETTYVSLVSSHYPEHRAPEWQFALKKQGCHVKDLTFEPTTASQMIIFESGTRFTFGQSAYYELTQFGSHVVIDSGTCTDNLHWTKVGKIPPKLW